MKRAREKLIIHSCDQPKCFYVTERKSCLIQHKMVIHDIGVKWYYCPHNKCNYKAKKRQDVTLHKVNIHNFETRHHKCNYPECHYKAKQHQANIHKR
jgi:hypothetical protein